MSSTKKITLKSNDGQLFEVDEADVSLCELIKGMIEDDCASDEIPLPNVTGAVFAKVIEFSKMNAASKTDQEDEQLNKWNEDFDKADQENELVNKWNEEFDKADQEDELNKWNEDFVKVDLEVLFDLILAANYLDNKKLLALSCQKIADTIKGKSPEEIRTLFNITDDYTPAEEAAVRAENPWAFE